MILPLMAYLSMVLGLHVFHSAWAAFGFYHGIILLLMAQPGNRSSWGELTRGWDWKIGLGSIVFGLGGGMVLYLLAPAASIDSTMIGPVLEKLSLQGWSWLLFVFYHSLVNPWFEELFWRGRLGDDRRIPVLNDLIFAGYHVLVLVLFLDWIWIVLAVFLLTLAGWLWRQLRIRCRGLLVPVISHLSADASIMFVIYRLNS